MIEYTVELSNASRSAVADGFCSMREVRVFLHSKGFEYSLLRHKWEQTYDHMDPDSIDSDLIWTKAEVKRKHLDTLGGAVLV